MLRGLSAAVYYLLKALPELSVVVQLGEAQILVGQLFKLLLGLLDGETSLLHLLQKLCYIHSSGSRRFLSFLSLRINLNLRLRSGRTDDYLRAVLHPNLYHICLGKAVNTLLVILIANHP